jgi:hypothetical protein
MPAILRILPLLALAALVSLATFRLTQPMTFRAPTGDTTLFTLHLNQDWVDSMEVAQNESRGIGAGPPGEQWVDRTALVFPLMNMVVWGMGLALGLAAWGGFGWALVRSFKVPGEWRMHLLPLVWVGGYFLFMGTRHVMSMRYFLPIYPFLALLAAWALLSWCVLCTSWRTCCSNAPVGYGAVGAGAAVHNGLGMELCLGGLPPGEYPHSGFTLDVS